MQAPTDVSYAVDAHPKANVPKTDTVNAIDASLRLPILLLAGSGVCWLVLSGFFSAITAWQAIDGRFLSRWEWLTYGRLNAAGETAFLYGWGTNTAYALGLWIMTRLCQRPLPGGRLLALPVIFWNAAIFFGLGGILLGHLTSVPSLQLPSFTTPLAALASLLIASWGIFIFCFRKTHLTYVAQWYLLAALFCFPWLFTIAQGMLFWVPNRGTVQTLTNLWFSHNLYGLFLMPAALATAFYLLPKILRKPLPHYHLSVLAFWTWMVFASWSGPRQLVGGATPVWLATTGIAATVLALLPVSIITLNYQNIVKQALSTAWRSLPLRFAILGLVFFSSVSLINAITALREMSAWLHATYFTEGERIQALYGAFSMPMFGGLYFMIPYLRQRPWPRPRLLKVHFWVYTIGLTLLLVSLYTGGWIQGTELHATENGKPVYTFSTVLNHIQPWLNLHRWAWILIATGHIVFALHFMWLLFSHSAKNHPSETCQKA